jgi:hypothetical protein
LVFQLFWFYQHWWDISCWNGHMLNPNLLQFPYLYLYMLLDQGAWDKVIYRLISKHFSAYHQYIVVIFSSYVRQANIHVLANSHLKQGIWALNPGEDRCSISRTVLSTISIVHSDVTIFFSFEVFSITTNLWLTTFCEIGHWIK